MLGPNLMGLLTFLLIGLSTLFIWNIGPRDKMKYVDYKDQISLKVIRTDTLKKENCKNCDLLNILVELENKTDVEWDNGEFEVAFRTAEGELVNIEKSLDFQLSLHPNSTATSSIKVPIYKEYSGSKVDIKLVNLRNDVY